ncbi:MAG: SUMF1/EgtB/PvdO family nonheme iron enzyme [Gemmataceae bacterium]
MSRLRTKAFLKLIVSVIIAILPSSALGEFRHALVIGQSNYKSGNLKNPTNDVKKVGDALERRGFTVLRAENLKTVKELDDTVKAFAKKVPTGGTALIYYSGIVAPLQTPPNSKALRHESALLALDGAQYSQDSLLRPLIVNQYGPYGNGWQGPQCGSRINVVIIDAAQPAQNIASMDVPKTEPPLESLIIFRASDDKILQNDQAESSPLAERFVKELDSNETLEKVLSSLSPKKTSSLTDRELSRLALPASKSVSEPKSLGRGTKPGDEWVDLNGIIFCWCPPGKFTIGSPRTGSGNYDELQSSISFSEGFWLAKHELCYRESIPLGGGIYLSTGEHKLHPVNKAGGFNLVKFLDTINSTAPNGWEYSLPTEAEWEYAAKAGTKTAYSFGDNPSELASYGNFADKTLRESTSRSEVAKAAGNSSPHKVYNGDLQTGLFSFAHPTWNDSSSTMARVGSYKPNPWGLCDMHGNVAEMTSTIYDPLRTAPTIAPHKRSEWASQPQSEKYSLGFVCKGGSWASLASSCRSSFRGWSSVTDNIIGLRIILRRRDSASDSPAKTWTTLVPTKFTTSSGSEGSVATDGTIHVNGKLVTGDNYSVISPIPAGIEPIALRLELLADQMPSGQGRQALGNVSIAEVGISASRGSSPNLVDILDVRSDLPNDVRSLRPDTPIANIVDGRLETFWNNPNDGKNHEIIFTLGLSSRTGLDGARWQYPSAEKKSMTSLVVTINHYNSTTVGNGLLRKFRLAVLHEDSNAPKKESAP